MRARALKKATCDTFVLTAATLYCQFNGEAASRLYADLKSATRATKSRQVTIAKSR